MAGDPGRSDQRRRRLEQVRGEIERDLGQGTTLSADEWRKRYPDLEPELGVMIQEVIGRVQTQAPGSPAVDIPAASDSTGVRPDLSPETLPADTVAPRPSPESAAPDDPLATAVGPSSSQQMTAAGSSGDETAPDVGHSAGPGIGQKVRYIGDYEIISVLGQGGMGVVFKARQLSLNRLVALKMIRNAEFASEDQLRRFQNEAEAVATLDHPGIVPIYEVGTYEDMRYFSMKLVEGQGLDKQLEGLAKDSRNATRVVAQVAEAVNHAHQRGILHRDLKPANILLDGLGHAHVTDFGLAKRIDEDAGLTVSGAIMGTPSYMSPEQAAGRSSMVTTASDVYGLGAILYAALTGRAPFAGGSVMNTLDQVRNSPPQPPTRHNAKLPRDLEVICLKCLEKDPRHRYASTQALCDDLNRWLRGEPIAARPVGPVVRLRMWARRKPALAGLSAALIVASIGGIIGVTWQWREAVSQRNQAQSARDDALRQEQAARKAEAEARAARDQAVASEKAAVAARGQAEQNAQIAGMQATLALNTIQDLVSQVQQGLQGPGLYDLKTALLGSALKRIDGVAGIYEKSTSKEATTAAALMELGKIYRQLGQTRKAFQTYQKCLEITRERVKIKNYSDPSRQNLANTYFELAFCSEELNRDMTAALSYNQDGLKLYEDIYKNPKLDDFPLNRKVVRAGLAEAYTRVGVTQYRMGELTAALENYRKAYNLRRELADENKDDPRLKQDLSFSTMALAETSFRLGDRHFADDLYRQVLEQREAMVKLKPNDLAALKELGDVFYMIGEFKLRCGDLRAGRRNLEDSRGIRKDLVDREPRNVLLGRDLGMTLYRLGNLADLEKKPVDARQMYEASLKIREELARISENNDRRQTELMLALAHTSQSERALELADRFSAGPNVDREQRIFLASCYAQAARSTPPEKAERIQTALVKAVESVRTAVREGFRDRVYLETEPDLEPLRNRGDFNAILGGIPLPKL
jgi:tetratricopeptide (TPR) repeat protein/tRNA A-37 threonylcarbamoyl transferase component Bud32